MSVIDFTTVTPCGECCVGCQKRASGFCMGCIESGGHCKEWEQSGGCPIYLCASAHEALFCGLCDEFPCTFLVTKVTWNPHVVADLVRLAKTYRRQKRKS